MGQSNEQRKEIFVQYLSTVKAKDMIGFETPTKLEDGLKTTVEWYTKHIETILKTKLED